MYYRNSFPFGITDVVDLLCLRVRHKGKESWDVDCPFCSHKTGKLNISRKKNAFRCNYCGESGGMLELYGRLHGMDNSTAYQEIKEALRSGAQAAGYTAGNRRMPQGEPETVNSEMASDEKKHAAYSGLLSFLCLTDLHRDRLLERGFTREQIERNLYRSTPAFGFKKLAGRLLESGCEVKGVPGFYQEPDGAWSVQFTAKSTGILIPVRSIDGHIVGMQVRMDKVADGRKYIWLSSVNRHMGASSGSPVHFVGDCHAETVFITEGPLKGDLSHALTGKAFGCVPGVNQHANLRTLLQRLKGNGVKLVYEAYDMDKLLDCTCERDYDGKCKDCGHFKEDREKIRADGWKVVVCEKKMAKKNNIQKGCLKFRQICDELELPYKMLTWDVDEDGGWAGKVKGVDDYLVGLKKG